MKRPNAWIFIALGCAACAGTEGGSDAGVPDTGVARVDAGPLPHTTLCEEGSFERGLSGGEIRGVFSVRIWLPTFPATPVAGVAARLEHVGGFVDQALDADGCAKFEIEGLRAPVSVHIFNSRANGEPAYISLAGLRRARVGFADSFLASLDQIETLSTFGGALENLELGGTTSSTTFVSARVEAFGPAGVSRAEADPRPDNDPQNIFRVGGMAPTQGTPNYTVRASADGTDGLVVFTARSEPSATTRTAFGFVEGISQIPQGQSDLTIRVVHALSETLTVIPPAPPGTGVTVRVGVLLPTDNLIMLGMAEEPSGPTQFAVPALTGALADAQYFVRAAYIQPGGPAAATVTGLTTEADLALSDYPGATAAVNERTITANFDSPMTVGYFGAQGIEWRAIVLYAAASEMLVFPYPAVPNGVPDAVGLFGAAGLRFPGLDQTRALRDSSLFRSTNTIILAR